MINIEFKTANGDITNPLGTFRKGNQGLALDSMDFVPTPSEICDKNNTYNACTLVTKAPPVKPVEYGIVDGKIQMLFPFCE